MAGPYELKEYVDEIKGIMRTMNKMEESRGLSKLNDKVVKMKKKLCQKIDLKYREIEQRRNLPKAVIPVFEKNIMPNG